MQSLCKTLRTVGSRKTASGGSALLSAINHSQRVFDSFHTPQTNLGFRTVSSSSHHGPTLFFNPTLGRTIYKGGLVGPNFTSRCMTTALPEISSSPDGSTVTPDVAPRIKFKRLDKTAGHIMKILDKEAVDEVKAQREIPDIKPGYMIQLKVEVPENKRRVSTFKGIVIARRNAGLNTTIRVRRMVTGVGVESLFPLYSPNIKEIKVLALMHECGLVSLQKWSISEFVSLLSQNSADYNSLGKYDREAYNEPRSYDRYGRDQDLYALEQRRVSSERISERSSITERRGRPRAESPDHVDESDLRYRLSKQRKVNGSRTGVSPDRREDFYRRDDRGRHVEDQRYRSHSRRDSRPLPPPESSISTRLAGRISLRGRSPSDSNHHESYREREVDRGRNWARLSPGRPLSSNYRGTSQDRIKRRVQEDFPADVRSFRPLLRRDDSDNETSDFAAPKRLSELKGSKGSEGSEERQTRGSQILSSDGKSLRSGKLGQELEGSSSFEGPKPLSEILKRKREEKGVAFGDDMVSGNKNGNGEDQISVKTSERKVEADDQTPSIKEEEEEEGLISEENAELTNEDQPSVPKGNEVETDDMIDKMEEDQDFEAYDQGDEEYEYDEQGDDGGDENADPDDEYVDDEDDFAKKIGVMFS